MVLKIHFRVHIMLKMKPLRAICCEFKNKRIYLLQILNLNYLLLNFNGFLSITILYLQ